MATKEEVLQVIQANQTVTLQRIAEVKTGVETLIAQGGGGSGAADLDAVVDALTSNQETVNTKIQEVRNLLPGGADLLKKK